MLHPRLSFVPCAAADFEAFRLTFAVDVAGAHLHGRGSRRRPQRRQRRADRVAAFDEAIEGILSAREQQDAADRRVGEVEVRLVEAQAGLERVAQQRAQVDEAVAEARARLAVLESAGVSDAELEQEVADAEAAAQAAEAALLLSAETAERRRTRDPQGAGRARPAPSASSNGSSAKASAAGTRSTRRRTNSSCGRPSAPSTPHDSSSTGCAGWRATTTAQQIVEAARDRVEAAARERLVAAEAALAERRAAGLPEDPAAEADALRTQIEAVERSLGDAEAARDRRSRKRSSRKRSPPGATPRPRPGSSSTRWTGWTPTPTATDMDAVLAELRHRREELTAGDEGLSAIGRVLRDLALDAPEPLFVLIEPGAEPGEDLIGALISVSGLKRTVVVTDKTEMLHEAREMDPALGAVREPLETGGTSRQELARSDGNRT